MRSGLTLAYWMMASLGFALQSAASYNGHGPQVPSFEAYAILAAVASACALAYGVAGSAKVRSLLVSCILVSMVGRSIGWATSWKLEYWERIVGIAPLIVIVGLALQVNALLRRQELKVSE